MLFNMRLLVKSLLSVLNVHEYWKGFYKILGKLKIIARCTVYLAMFTYNHVVKILTIGVMIQVCVKGPNVFLGYYRDKAKTEEALDKDGWLHTGDIGQWLEVRGHLISWRERLNKNNAALTTNITTTEVISCLLFLVFPEWYSEDYWQKEEHFQASPGKYLLCGWNDKTFSF